MGSGKSTMITKCIKWTPDTGFDQRELAGAKEILEQGGLVAFPTETVYGLGGNGLMPEAAKKIYAAKGRPSDNPLILHIADREQLDKIVRRVPVLAERLAEAFWPGPLTMIFEKAASVPYETTGGLDTVAVRMPDHAGALEFLKAVSIPVAAPSANTSGRPSPTAAKHVQEDLGGKIDMIIDGGGVGIGLESTIVDMTETVPVILRPGYITKEMIAEVIGDVVMDPALETEKKTERHSGRSGLRPKAPGMKYRHYAPKAAMIVFQGEKQAVVAHIQEQIHAFCHEGTYLADEIGILTTEEMAGAYPVGQVLPIGSEKSGTVGRNLYAALRRFDELHVKLILSESFYGMEKEEAVMNRLLKAAGQNIVHVE